MKLLRQVFGFTVILSLIFIFIIQGTILTLLIRDRWKLKKILIHCNHIYAKWGLWAIGLDLQEEGEHKKDECYLYVSNHLSYVDVLIMAAQKPSCFVTSQEIRKVPVLGWLCETGGCLFVERRSRDNLKNEIGELTHALSIGLSVVIFPEATSTNGDEVIRFRQPLYTAAIESGRSVQPMCMNYLFLGSDEVTLKNRDLICWYGDMSFAPHLWKLLGFGSVTAELTYLQEMPTTPESQVKELSETSHKMVSETFKAFK